ncbi:hypothetical protein JCM5350_006576 [Sporobolomyces pararoseus]
MPVTSYFPPDHDRPPPVVAKQQLSPPSSPSSQLPRSTLTRSTSEQLSIPNRFERDGERIAARRRSSALGDLDEAAIRELSARAKEAELRAQWEGRVSSRPRVVAPPSTPPRSTRRHSNNLDSPSASSLYQTPTSVARTPTRSPRSPRSRDPSYSSPGGRASSIRSNFSSSTSTSSNLSAVSEFLAEEEPPPTTLGRQRNSSSSNQFLSSSRPSSSSRSSIRSNRSTSIFPTTNLARSSSVLSHSPRSSFDDDESSDEEVDEEPHIPISSQFSGPRLVKTTLETDQFVQVLNLEKQQLLQSRQQQQQQQQTRGRERTKSSSNGEGGGTTDHSRSESGNSDASFASMTAVGPLGIPTVEQVKEEEESFGRGGGEKSLGLSSTGMERDDTLRPSTTSSNGIGTGNRWDQSGGGAGGAKSIDEIVNGFKALGVGNEVRGIVERRRSSIATLQGLPTRRDASLEEYQYPPLSISTAASLDQDRPLSPDSIVSSTSSTMLPYVPFPIPPSNSSVTPGGKIKSIEEIIAQHAGTSYLSNNPVRAASPSSTSPSTPISNSFTGRTRVRELSNISSAGSENSSADSYNSIQQEIKNSTIGSSRKRDPPALAFDQTPSSDTRSIRSVSSSLSPRSNSPIPHTPSTASPSSLSSPSNPTSQKLQQQQELSLLLRSPRLTRLVPLSRPSNASVTVSLSDVGSPTGHPVLIFLGLGSVRYILALFEELADIFGLRLICIDRWGIGKTTNVPDKGRGFREWSQVVEEVVEDHLELSQGYSVLAHSAGSPYGLVNALRSDRVKGTVHLLAPWVVGAGGETEGVGMNADNLAGMYKYLKFVPSGVLKTAQQAEWKIQGWRLGKSPLLLDENELNEELESVGNGAVTPRKDKRESSSLASLGIVGSGEVVDKLERLYPDGGIRLAGPHVNAINSSTSTPVKGTNRPRRKASLSVNGKSLFGGIFASGGGGGSAKSNRSYRSGGADDTSSLRPSIASNSTSTGRRSSYYAASAINSPLSEINGLPSGLTSPATPTSASSTRQSPFIPERSPSPAPPLSSSLTPQRPHSSISFSSASSTNHRPSSPSTLLTPASPSTPHRASIAPSLLISGLLRASHAESLSGSTSDLLVLLDRSNNARNSIDYKQIQQPVKVWYGDKDDRISESSIMWLEKEIRDCKVQVVKGADHNLMTNHQVMFDVLESISKEFHSNR